MRRRPIIRYHGGKHRLSTWILSHLPSHRIYVEPYCGAASVLMAKPRVYSEVINDLSGEIVTLFRVLRDHIAARRLEEMVRLTPYARTEFEAAYEPAANDDVEVARRLIVRSYMGFGSAAHNRFHMTGFRSNVKRSGTTPAHDWVNYPDHIQGFTSRLQGVVIENRHALTVIRMHDSIDTLFYVDPPYVLSTRQSIRNHYEGDRCYEYEMSDEEHRDLASTLHRVQGMVVLSGYRSSLYDDLFPGWLRADKETHGDGATDRIESLWLNDAAQERLDRYGAVI